MLRVTWWGAALLSLALAAPALAAPTSLGVHVGYWTPKLDEANDAIRAFDRGLERYGLRVQGDDSFSGGVTFGGTVLIGIGDAVALRVETSYWKQTLEQSSNDVVIIGPDTLLVTGEGKASCRIIPVLVSAQYYLLPPSAPARPYLGGGAGFALVDAEVEGIVRARGPNLIDDLAGGAMESSSGLVFELLGGIDVPIGPFVVGQADARYLIGSAHFENERRGLDDDLSLSGFAVTVGVRVVISRQ